MNELLKQIAEADLTTYTGALDNADLPQETLKQIKETFESAVKGVALDVAESAIEDVKSKAEAYAEYVKEEMAEKAEAYGDYIKESYAEKIDTYLSHIAETWLNDNKIAITGGIKESMFDVMMGELKTIFVENNIEIPDEKVDIVEELEAQLSETTKELDNLLLTNKTVNERLNELEKERYISTKTTHLTESQKERVETLAENLCILDENFEKQLDTILSTVTINRVDEGVKKPVLNTVKNKTFTESNQISSYINAKNRLG